jgi:hypothetical protein
MITAHQAEIIALMGDGEIIHRDCLNDEAGNDEATREWRRYREEYQSERGYSPSDMMFWQFLEDTTGFVPLSRYDIHTVQDQNLESDVDYYMSESLVDLTDRFDGLKDAIIEHLDDTGKVDPDFVRDWLYENVEAEALCDRCMKPIT